MAKSLKYLQGKVSWVKHIKPDEKYGKWTVKLHPDNPSLEKIREMQTSQNGVTGIKNILGKDDDGYFMNFSRPTKKEFKRRDGMTETRAFAPPVVVTKDGTPWDDKGIGNGSDGTVELEYYTFNAPGGGKGSAVRWERLRIDTLVPYDIKKDLTPEELKEMGPIVVQPKPMF